MSNLTTEALTRPSPYPALNRPLQKPQASPRLLRVSALSGVLTCKPPCIMHISPQPPLRQPASTHPSGLCQGTAASWEVPPTPRELLWHPELTLTYCITSFIIVASLSIPDHHPHPPVSTVSYSPFSPWCPQYLAYNRCSANNG